MKTMLLSLCLTITVFSCGCGIQSQPAAPNSFFMLNAAPQTVVPDADRANYCLRLRPVNVQAPFTGTALIYRTGERTWEKDLYNQFLVPADQQLNNLLADQHKNMNVTDCIEGIENNQARLTLEPHLEALYIDFRTPASPAAYAKIRFVLTRYDRSCRCSSIISDQTLEAAAPLPPRPAADAAVEAMSKAIQDILERFQAELKNAR